MAKVTFSQLGLKPNDQIASFEHNDRIVEIKQYLPLQTKLDLITKVLFQSTDDNGYYNIGKIEFFMMLEIVFAYTNITFTEKQKEDLNKIYDLLVSNGIWEDIVNCMNPQEYNFIRTVTYETIKHIYEYNNSVYGVLDNISKNYSDLDLDATKIQQKLADGENVEFLKEVLTKLG